MTTPAYPWLEPLSTAITEACDENFVTKFVVVAEIIDNDGTKSLRILADPQLMGWDRLGMFQVAAMKTQQRLAGQS
jgi:hypothetical protein